MKQLVFLDKTLLAVADAARQSLFSDRYAYRRGLLQALDVRVKLLTFLCILILASFLHKPETLWALHGLSITFAVVSGVSLLFFLKRVWLFIPLFSAVIVLPALLNVVTPGDPVLVLIKLNSSYSWGPWTIPSEIAITSQGIHGAVLFVSRVAVSVSFAVLFTLTSKWPEVFSGLRSLFVPRVFIVTLNLALRYLFVLLRLIQDMYLARKSRTIRPFRPGVERGWTASRIGFTFRKSLDMNHDIYKAMLSRGFHGDFRALNRSRISALDILWIATVVCLSGIMIVLERGLR